MTDVKRLLDEATPLPWHVDGDRYEPIQMRNIEASDGTAITCGATSEYDCLDSPSNAALIVYAVNRLPDYEAAVDALERLVEVFADGLGTHRTDATFCSLTDEGHDAITIGRAALRRLRGESDV